MFCHGFVFLSVMQKTRFFEKCGIVYVETEKTHFEYEMYSISVPQVPQIIVVALVASKIETEDGVCSHYRKQWKQFEINTTPTFSRFFRKME